MHFQFLRGVIERLIRLVFDGQMKNEGVFICEAESFCQPYLIIAAIAHQRLPTQIAILSFARSGTSAKAASAATGTKM